MDNDLQKIHRTEENYQYGNHYLCKIDDALGPAGRSQLFVSLYLVYLNSVFSHKEEKAPDKNMAQAVQGCLCPLGYCVIQERESDMLIVINVN